MRNYFTAAESAEELALIAAFHEAIVQGLSGRMISIIDLELKLKSAEHLYLSAVASNRLQQRIRELDDRRDLFTKARISLFPVVDYIICTKGDEALVSAVYDAVCHQIFSLNASYQTHADPVTDAPSFRVIKQNTSELEEIRDFGKSFLGASAKSALANNIAFAAYLEAICKGHMSGAGTPELQRIETDAINRSACGRDPRFEEFDDTRDYARAAAKIGLDVNSYEGRRLIMMWLQRDELDAIETFSNVLFQLPDAEPELRMSLARFVWDEARHAESGQRALGDYGIDAFSLPTSTIGIKVRGSMPPEMAFAQISLLGEKNVISQLRSVRDEARRLGDRATESVLSYIYRDELSHLRIGRQWLKKIFANDNLVEIERLALFSSGEALARLGVVGEDWQETITSRELAEIIGE